MISLEAIDLPLVIIKDVVRASGVLWAAVALGLMGCRDRLHNKDRVQEAILKRLESHSGLDLKNLDVTTTQVTFDKNMAYATVAFHPKDDPNVNSGLVMKYTLHEHDGAWEVTNVGDAHGGRMGRAAEMPSGHPQVGSGEQGAKE